MLALAERTWQSHDLAPGDQFPAWEHVVAELFMPVALSRATGTEDSARGFPTVVQARQVGDAALLWLASPGHRVTQAGPVAGPGVHYLTLPLAGQGVVTQDGRHHLAGVGDLVLLNGSRPFVLDFAGPLELLCLKVSAEQLDPVLADHGAAHPVIIAAASGSGAVARGMVRSIAQQSERQTYREAHGVLGHLLGVLALAAAAAVHAEHPPDSRVVHLQAALDEIERSLGDPDLGPAQVAQRIAISVSYLTKLFAARGTSFGRHLLTRRLDRAYTLLDPALSMQSSSGTVTSVTSVAMSCGFRDSAHFARTFRARYGLTPSERRAGCAGTSLGG